MDTSSGNIIISFTPEKNPMRISTVIKCILEFLSLSDLKNGRLICRQWNSEAEPLLRRKAKILFTADFGTSDYFEYYSDSRISAVPFTAFKFTNHFEGDLGYLETDLDYFFNKCGKNIKSLEFDKINIWKDKHDLHKMEKMNISPWIELLPDNVDKLKIDVCDSSTGLTVNLENLAGAKSLSLCGCDVIVKSANINRIVPSKIALTSVTFFNESNTKLANVVVHDFVDFSKCSNIKLCKSIWSNTNIKFDMSKDIVDAKNVKFLNIQVLNSGVSKIKTDFLSVIIDPSEAIKMQMKELDIKVRTAINLSNLPQTIEKLTISENFYVPHVAVPLNLPNLKYLHFYPPTMGESEGVLPAWKLISWLKNCSNLVDVHLWGLERKCALDVFWLPRSLRRLKLSEFSQIVFVGDRQPIGVDVLVLDASINSLEVERITEKIIPKMLVKIVKFHKDDGGRGSERAEDFLSFVRNNTQLEKIVINMAGGLFWESLSGRNRFLQFVGEESAYYEFNNQIAKAISSDEFETYYDINYMN